MSATCQRCNLFMEDVVSTRRFCMPCQPARFKDNGGYAAHQAVAAAVNRGDLPRAKTQTCVDCGKPACDYDHRDYSKVLDVQPVCRSCNRRRGPALFAFKNEAVKAAYFSTTGA